MNEKILRQSIRAAVHQGDYLKALDGLRQLIDLPDGISQEDGCELMRRQLAEMGLPTAWLDASARDEEPVETVEAAPKAPGRPKSAKADTEPSGPLAGAVVVTSPAALAKIVRTAVREELAATEPREPKWLDRHGVAALTGYAVTYVSELVRKHGLPVHGRPRKQRFLRSEVLTWLEEHRKSDDDGAS